MVIHFIYNLAKIKWTVLKLIGLRIFRGFPIKRSLKHSNNEWLLTQDVLRQLLTCISFLTTSLPTTWSNMACSEGSSIRQNLTRSLCHTRILELSRAVTVTWKYSSVVTPNHSGESRNWLSLTRCRARPPWETISLKEVSSIVRLEYSPLKAELELETNYQFYQFSIIKKFVCCCGRSDNASNNGHGNVECTHMYLALHLWGRYWDTYDLNCLTFVLLTFPWGGVRCSPHVRSSLSSPSPSGPPSPPPSYNSAVSAKIINH